MGGSTQPEHRSSRRIALSARPGRTRSTTAETRVFITAGEPAVGRFRSTRATAMTKADIAATGTTIRGRVVEQARASLLVVPAITSVLGLTGLVLLRAVDPATDSRPVLLVICLMAIAGAVVLNATTIDSAGWSGRVRRESPEASRRVSRRLDPPARRVLRCGYDRDMLLMCTVAVLVGAPTPEASVEWWEFDMAVGPVQLIVLRFPHPNSSARSSPSWNDSGKATPSG